MRTSAAGKRGRGRCAGREGPHADQTEKKEEVGPQKGGTEGGGLCGRWKRGWGGGLILSQSKGHSARGPIVRGGEGDRAIVLWRRRKRRRRDRNERGGGGGRPLLFLLLLRDRRADHCHSAEIWGEGGLGTCSRTSEEEEEGEETPFRTDKRSIRPTAPHHAAFPSSSRLWTSPRFIVDISPSLHFLDPRTYVRRRRRSPRGSWNPVAARPTAGPATIPREKKRESIHFPHPYYHHDADPFLVKCPKVFETRKRSLVAR